MKHFIEKLISDIAHSAGVTINGKQPWDIQVHNQQLYSRIIKQGTLGFGEAYMDGWWDSQKIDQMIYRLFRSPSAVTTSTFQLKLYQLMMNIPRILHSVLFNQQSKQRAKLVATTHYDIGNDLYQAMLDKRLTYTCGYWKNAANLDEAQQAKLKLICDKLRLQPNMSVLDIGCGWGSFAKFAAEHYGVKITGITISKQQATLAKQLCNGLPIDIRYQDYRDVNDQFDHIVSVGMFEHVGFKNYHTFMKMVYRCLSDDGLFLLHTIGKNDSSLSSDPWITRYIFPNGYLPSIKHIGQAIEHRFIMEDWHNFGADYDKTLMAWYNNFIDHWQSLKHNYDERFKRMWNYYLLSCAGMFRARKLQAWQIVLSKHGVKSGYQSIR